MRYKMILFLRALWKFLIWDIRDSLGADGGGGVNGIRRFGSAMLLQLP
jgi:hypothetical protein